MQYTIISDEHNAPNTLADKRFEQIKTDILCPAFREIALTYCVTTSDFYDTVHEMEFSLSDMIKNSTGKYVRSEQINRSNHRLNNLLSRLIISEEPCLGEPSMRFFMPKVFDARLSEAMTFSFQSISDLIGDAFFASSIPANHLRAIGIDGRDKFAFPEYAALCCLYIALNGPALRTLNRPIETANQLKRAKPRMCNIRDVLFSEKYCRVITKTVFDLMAVAHEKDYNSLLTRHLSEFWLKPEKKGLKTLGYALQKHTVEKIDVYAFFSGENAEENSVRFLQEYGRIDLMQYMFYVICPVAEALAIQAVPAGLSADSEGVISLQENLMQSPVIDTATKEQINRQPRSNFCISACDYLVAEKVADVVTSFVSAIQQSVVMLLECLPESSIAGDEGLWDYFKRIP